MVDRVSGEACCDAGFSQEDIRDFASEYLNVIYGPGEPGYCNPNDATWAVEYVHPEQLNNIFSGSGLARKWLDEEILMAEQEGLARDWKELLEQDIREEVIILMRDGIAYVWDGWHRTAAAIAKGVPIKAFVGRPINGHV